MPILFQSSAAGREPDAVGRDVRRARLLRRPAAAGGEPRPARRGQAEPARPRRGPRPPALGPLRGQDRRHLRPQLLSTPVRHQRAGRGTAPACARRSPTCGCCRRRRSRRRSRPGRSPRRSRTGQVDDLRPRRTPGRGRERVEPAVQPVGRGRAQHSRSPRPPGPRPGRGCGFSLGSMLAGVVAQHHDRDALPGDPAPGLGQPCVWRASVPAQRGQPGRWSGSRRSPSRCGPAAGRAARGTRAAATGRRRPGAVVVDQGQPPSTNMSAVTRPASTISSTIVISTRACESPTTATCGYARRPVPNRHGSTGRRAAARCSGRTAGSPPPRRRASARSCPRGPGWGSPGPPGRRPRRRSSGGASATRRAATCSVCSISRATSWRGHHADARSARRRRSGGVREGGAGPAQPEAARGAHRVLDPALGQRRQRRSWPAGSRPCRAWSARGRWRRAAG